MRTRTFLLAALVLAAEARAERPPQQKDTATDVVVGTVEKIKTDEKKFFDDGVRSEYTATVKVEKADKGDLKAGDTISVKWFRVTRFPSKPVAGAAGHAYPAAKEKETVKVWLIKSKDGTYGVIYNKDGMEKAGK